MIRPRAALALGLLLSALTSGCDDHDYGHLEVEVTTAASPRSEVAADRMVIPVGSAIGFDAHAFEEDGDPVEGTLRLQSEDTSVLGLTPGPDEGSFVVFGRGVGRTTVSVRVDGDRVDSIDVEVVAQE